MISIIAALMPLFIRLIGQVLDSKEFTTEQKEAYLNFVDKMQLTQDGSAKIAQSYDSQVDILRAKIEAEKAAQNVTPNP